MHARGSGEAARRGKRRRYQSRAWQFACLTFCSTDYRKKRDCSYSRQFTKNTFLPTDLLFCQQFYFRPPCPLVPDEVCSSPGFYRLFRLAESLSAIETLLFLFVSPLVTLPARVHVLPAELLNFVRFFLSLLSSFPVSDHKRSYYETAWTNQWINHVNIKIPKQTRGPKSAGKAVKGAKRGNVTESETESPLPLPPKQV